MRQQRGPQDAERSWAGLGAITVMIVAVVAYAAIGGALLMPGVVRGAMAGELDVVRSLAAVLLVTPAVAVLAYMRRTAPVPPAGARS